MKPGQSKKRTAVTEFSEPVRPRPLWRLGRRDLLVIGTLILVAWFIQTFFLNYTVDDAFISFRYSRNLAQGMGLVFNPGERVEGFTNFLWTLYCALPFAVGLDVLWFAKLTLMLLAAASLVLVVLLCRAVAPRGQWWLAFLPAGLLATHTSFTVYAVNGIETQLFVFMLLLGLLLVSREFEYGGFASAFALVGLFLTRPDGALLAGIVWLARLLFGRRDRSLLIWTLVLAAAVVGLTAFRVAYFGHLVPNTYYVKSAGTLGLRVSRWGMRYFEDIMRVPANWLYMLLPLAAMLRWRSLLRYGRLLLLIPCLYLAYVLYIGGDVNFPHFRFLLHVLPVMAVVGFTVFAGRRTPQGRTARPGRVGPVAAIIITVVFVGLQLAHTVESWRQMNRTEESPPFRYGALFPLAGPISIYPEMADSLRATCQPGSVVVMQDVGAIPFYSGVRTFDIIGLVNGRLASYVHRMGYSDYLRGLLPVNVLMEVDAHIRDMIIDSVRADYVLYHVDSGDPQRLEYSFHFHDLAADLRFKQLYRPIRAFRYPGTGRYDHILFERTQP